MALTAWRRSRSKTANSSPAPVSTPSDVIIATTGFPLPRCSPATSLEAASARSKFQKSLSSTTPPTVYNLEVYGEHVYELLDCGILVHNSEEDCAKIARELLAPGGTLETLARNDDLLAKNLGGRLKDHTPHHLIGVAEAQKFDVLTRAAELGYDINRGTNGINLPNKLDLAKELNLPYHPKRWRHRVKTYTGPIDDRLIEFQRRYDKGLINDSTLLDEIRKLEDSIHDDLIIGKLRLNCRYQWYPQE